MLLSGSQMSEDCLNRTTHFFILFHSVFVNRSFKLDLLPRYTFHCEWNIDTFFFFLNLIAGSRLMWKKMLWKSKRICFSYEEGYRFYVLDVCLWLLGGKIIITSDNAVIKVATMAWTQKPSLKAKGNGRRGAPLHCFSKFMCCVKHSG